ncbi:MAG: hypothetical protein OXN21_09780, partial [Chloroflexota bacterium]|nr:hypothetical protein [Chloroflexota bacterium]
FTSSDFQVENGALVARKTVSVTILEDDVYEGDEHFHLHFSRDAHVPPEVVLLDSQGDVCDDECPNPYVVTITDNEPAVSVSFDQAAYTVIEGGSQGIIVTLSEDPRRTVEIPIVAVGQDGATDDDYSGIPLVVTFRASEASSTIVFTANYDRIDDGGESVKLSFGSMLPPGVTQGPINETVVTITQRELIDDTGRPGISEPMCQSRGIYIFWHTAAEFEDDPPPHGWRVERRRLSGGEWITDRFDFLGAAAEALQTHSDEYWDWTDRTRRLRIDYTYRVHALNDDGELMEGRDWSRRAPALCQ